MINFIYLFFASILNFVFGRRIFMYLIALGFINTFVFSTYGFGVFFSVIVFLSLKLLNNYFIKSKSNSKNKNE